MPKTRDELCQQAIIKLMSSTYDIQYRIVSLTTHKSVSVHYYDIEMPKLIQLYDVDTNHTINGITYGPGPIFTEQDLPTAQEFTVHFNNYFEEYAYYEESAHDATTRSDGRRTSFIETTHVSDEGDKLVATVIVKYIKQFYPYPVEPSPDNFETKYNDLKRRYDDQHSQLLLLISDNKHYRRRVSRLARDSHVATYGWNLANKNVQSVRHKITSLQTIIKTLYEKNTTLEDCPVCYESMPADKLFVPECGHFICSTCSAQCARCPICRDDYAVVVDAEVR